MSRLKKSLEVQAWAGFVDGKLHFYRNSDWTNQPIVADLFRSRRQAGKQYADVRRVTVRVEEPR